MAQLSRSHNVQQPNRTEMSLVVAEMVQSLCSADKLLLEYY